MKKRILMIGGKSVPSFEETMGRYWQNAAAEPGNATQF